MILSTVAQDLSPEGNDSAAHQHASVTATIRKFADAAAQVGIDLETLIAILDSGVPMQAVLDLIHTLLEAQTATEP